MPVNKLLISMALPMMISMLVQALYNVVDSIFVSRICEDALTAVSMAFPMQNLLIGLASGIGVGTNALLSRSLGEKKQDMANKVAMQGVFLAIVSYFLFLVLGLTIARTFFVLQDASDVIADYGHDYLSVIMICSFGVFMQVIFERLLQGTGRTLYTMYTQGLGAIINIILDPIMIFGLLGCPKMGIAGAAIATVIGQTVAGILALIFNIKKNDDIQLSLKRIVPNGRILANILKIGIPSVIMVAIGSVMTFSVNKILVVFTSTAVAVFGIYFKLQSFCFMPVFGLNNAMVPIVAFNYGARQPERMIKTRKLAIVYAECLMIAAMLVAMLIPDKLLLLFDASENMLSIGMPALRIMTIAFIFAGFCIITSSFFQALEFSVYSMMISFTRQIVFLVPLAYIFSKTGSLNMVWLAWPLAELASVALCLFYMRRVNRTVIAPLYEKGSNSNN